MRLSLSLALGSGSGGGSVPPVEPPFFASDTTSLSDRTASWHADTTARSASHLLMGYSKSSSEFGIAEHDPNTGAVVDARVILDEPTLYTSINDHFMVVPHIVQNGPHAGQLWALTLPHGPGTADPGNRRFYARYAVNGRTSGLVPADNGSGLDYAEHTGTMNYGNLHERSDGRIVVLSIDDSASPQALRAVWTDNPAVVPTIGRLIASMSGIPSGGLPQLYSNSVPDADGNVRAFLFLHPSVPDAPIKTFRINLTTGQVLVGATPQGSGTIYDTSGSAMLSYGSAPAINAPSGNTFTRLHDVCQFGDYQYGYAVALTQGPIGSDLDVPSHIVRYCDPADDIEVAANWSQVNIGAANRARSWDNGGTNGRRYNSDIRFLPPVADEGFRCALIAYDGSGLYRTEEWAGASPDTAVLVGTTPWVSTPRPMRLFVNPGAGDCAALAYSFASYTAFTDFVPGVAQPIVFDEVVPTAPSVLTSPVLQGDPTVGNLYESTAATFTGQPTPTVSTQWWIADDDTGAGAAPISGATSASYTPVTGDIGKSLQRRDTATNGVSPDAVASSDWSLAVAAASGFAWSSVGDFVELDPATATVSGGTASALASTTADGGTATAFTALDSTREPAYIAGPPARLDYDGTNDLLDGNATARAFTQNRSALMALIRVEPDVLPGATALMLHIGGGSTATQQRLGLRISSSNQLQAVIRRLDGDSATVLTGPTITAGAKYLCAVVVNYGTPSTASLWVNGTEYTGGVPTSGAASSNTASLLTQMGGAVVLPGSASQFNGKLGGVVLLAKSTGSISPTQVADALAKYDADYPAW